MTAADAVRAAWVDPGPAPILHRAHQVRLRREWPALADALDRLAASPAPHIVAETWTVGLRTPPGVTRHPQPDNRGGNRVRLFHWSDGLTTLTPERTP